MRGQQGPSDGPRAPARYHMTMKAYDPAFAIFGMKHVVIGTMATLEEACGALLLRVWDESHGVRGRAPTPAERERARARLAALRAELLAGGGAGAGEAQGPRTVEVAPGAHVDWVGEGTDGPWVGGGSIATGGGALIYRVWKGPPS